MQFLSDILILIHFFNQIECQSKIWQKLNLPHEHIPYFFNSNPGLRKKCLKEEFCPHKEHAQQNATKCWGYEKNCKMSNRLFLPECPGSSNGWVNDKQEQIELFWKQGDFGYIKERLGEMKTYCQPENPGDSKLECVDHLRMCRAKNIFFDFADLNSKYSNDRYREDIFKQGQVGGRCKLDSDLLRKNGDHKSPLQSWYSELQLFQEFETKPIDDKKCDIVVNEPTFLIKLDAGVNMYHHFCDFINLYVTQHANNSFLQNVNIVFWDTSGSDYWSYFSDMWKVFSNKKPIHIRVYDKKKVCFRDAVFSFLARMRFGLFYNMPLIYGCHGSGLFRSFSEHVLHRFKISQEGPLEDKIRITFLARGTQFRNILNQDQIVKEIRKKLGKKIELKLVTYDIHVPFVDQIKTTHNSDIFMSMHGSGLTHLLFLPDWATVFEIHNCEDKDCYADLARLRGIKYFTWENESKVYPQDDGKHPQLGTPHKKFTNYSFDTKEFIRIVNKMIEYVKNHPKYREKLGKKYPKMTEQKSEL
ncbi:EGF domain-specific O-linked N-acetylglucosamine transferase [Brachionus plicatilis]|uniref:EGF domain-specific O-linked N-acetylglucosamine transferase n=1 Tax=Brachionus plicatilis TaxID=10195 RepID=A0A3M7T670_BRAPC|nr:EGF domain-specific O-linked N-acetylglucosamine transferase [Brachionus plicatilis]